MSEDDFDRAATRRDVIAILDDKQVATRSDVTALREELRTHFDLVAEQFKAEFKNLFDWTEATTSSIGARVDGIEGDHGSKLTSLEIRVTKIEQRQKS